MDCLVIGVENTLTFKFKGNIAFQQAPQFDVIMEDDTVLISGDTMVSSSSGAWDVIFTIPSNYSTQDGSEIITVEVYGTDTSGKLRSIEKEYKVIDATDEYTPIGIIALVGESVSDSIILDAGNLQPTSFNVSIKDENGTVILAESTLSDFDSVTRVLDKTELPDRFSTPKFNGYKYSFTLNTSSIEWPEEMKRPFQILIKVKSGNKVVKFESHPVYRLTDRWISHLTSLKSYLDKARLDEIDPTLQWHDDELCQYLIDGMNYINAFPATVTYWSVDKAISPLFSTITLAAAYVGLNARYLAEGLTNFDFSGLSTSLNVDRRDTITYKIDEIKGFLDTNLKDIKNKVVGVAGVGTPSTTDNVTDRPIAALGIGISPVSNRFNPAIRPIRYW